MQSTIGKKKLAFFESGRESRTPSERESPDPVLFTLAFLSFSCEKKVEKNKRHDPDKSPDAHRRVGTLHQTSLLHNTSSRMAESIASCVAVLAVLSRLSLSRNERKRAGYSDVRMPRSVYR